MERTDYIDLPDWEDPERRIVFRGNKLVRPKPGEESVVQIVGDVDIVIRDCTFAP